MFQETKRGWEARAIRESVDVHRGNASKAGRKTRRRHSTLAEPSSLEVPQDDRNRNRYLRDRKEKRKERCYTSSAFDSTKAKDHVDSSQNRSSSSSDPNSSPSSSGSGSTSSPQVKDVLTIDIPERDFTHRKKSLDRASEGVASPKHPIRKDKRKIGHGTSYSANRTLHVKRNNASQIPRPLFRVTSNYEQSSRRTVESASASYHNTTSIDQHGLSKRPLDENGLVPIPTPEKRLHSDLVSPRHADRERKTREEGLRARISPRSPHQPQFTGRPTRNFARASPKLNASQRAPTSINVVKKLSYDDINDQGDHAQVQQDRRTSEERSSSPARSSGQLREDSNFSRLSAQSWMSVESEETLTERETSLLTSKKNRSSRQGSSGGRSGIYHVDHHPATLFGVDEDGNALERISNDDPYSLSVLECGTIIQIGADISKKLGFNRYEQRRVWMSSDFLRLCWTSKKAGVSEDSILLSQVARIKLADRTLGIDMIGGYGLCFMFPSATSAGLWVRSLACLVPLQAQLRVPLGVVIASERDREEFSLAEDKFGHKHVREYMTVNNYVPLCNPTCTPRHTGVKMAFSLTEDCFYGFRYIPRQAIHHMLRTRKEIALLKRLNHPNIVIHYEILADPEHGGLYAVFEHLSRGCIADSSNLQRMQIYREAHVRMIIVDIVDALLYLHSKRITHADVRPENILMAPNGCAKLNPIGCIMHDFNHIENRTAHARCRLGNASTAFLAPEQCWLSRAPKAGKLSTAMDVWGVGALMYTLLYGKTPFHGANDHEVQESICWGTTRFPIETQMSKEAKSLMFQILSNKDPRTRMKMSEVREHPWFNECNSSSSASRQNYSNSSANVSSVLSFSPHEINSAIQQANVRITARNKKFSRGTPRRA